MNNWQTKKLGEVATIASGYAFKSSELADYKKDNLFLPVIKIGNLGANGKLSLEKVQYFKSNKKLEQFKISEKDILVAMTGATVGKTAISHDSNLFLNQRVGIIRPNIKMVFSEFLTYILLGRKFYEYCQIKAGGGAQGNISSSKILSFTLVIPSIVTQQKIVKRLDAIRETQELNEEKINKTTDLFNNIVRDIFSSKSGEKSKINEVVDCFQYGLSRAMNSDSKGMPIFRINSIRDGEITNEDLKHVEVTDQELEKYKVEFNDILFNRTNSYELVGKTGIFKLKGTYIFASYLIRLKTNDKVLPDYLNYFLNSSIGQAEIKKKAKRAVSQANVNAKELGSITIYIPEKSIQKEKVEQLDTIKKYLQILNQKDQKLLELFESTLNKLLSRKNYE